MGEATAQRQRKGVRGQLQYNRSESCWLNRGGDRWNRGMVGEWGSGGSHRTDMVCHSLWRAKDLYRSTMMPFIPKGYR